jgi:hypothetical protein
LYDDQNDGGADVVAAGCELLKVFASLMYLDC